MSSKSQPIGIDLGTTYSLVAYLDDNDRSVVLPNAEGDLLTPSVVLFEDDEVIVGNEAWRAGLAKIGRVADRVKRDMGKPVYSRPIRGKYLPPETIAAYLLRKLRDDASAKLGAKLTAVITVPAYFDEPRRDATATAAKLADLELLDIVNEPTAAALAFGEELGYLTPEGAPRETMKVLVYDLGGGTFDVTVIEMRPGDIRTLATDGDVALGGHEWDLRLADYASERFMAEHGADLQGELASLQRLLVKSEEAKRTLGMRRQAIIETVHKGNSSRVPVTREVFESMTSGLLERTAHTTRQVLAAASLKFSDIDRILMVGGSTRMPMVGEMIEKLSGKSPERSINPDEMVARGAAIFAGYLMGKQGLRVSKSKFQVTDVNSHSLGIQGVDQQTQRKTNAVLIPRNTPLPHKVTKRFVTRRQGQRSIAVNVLEGENTDPDECAAIGKTTIRDLPSDLRQGSPVEVTYEYKTNGCLRVEALVRGTGQSVELKLERNTSLSGDQVDQWKRALRESGGLDSFESIIEDALADEQPTESDTSTTARHSESGALPCAQTQSPAKRTAATPSSPNTAATPAATEIPTDAELPTRTTPASSVQSPQVSSHTPTDFPEPELPPTAAGPPLVSTPAFTMQNAAPNTGVVHPTSTQPAASVSPQVADVVSPEDGISGIGAIETQPRHAKSNSMFGLYALGHIMASMVGLVIGYYLLCYVRPEANFLDLHLPGLRQPVEESPPATPQSEQSAPFQTEPANEGDPPG